jgi:predicted AAA+ superfamily ATPase
MHYKHRVAEASLRRYLKVFPVVGLTGPRQSGKSTLLRHLLPDYAYVTFDDPKHVSSFMEDAVGFLKIYSEHVIFDEVQRVPELFHYIKMLVDQDRDNYGNIVLTGSSQFQFLHKATESLAGRMGLMSLLPFQYNEMANNLTNESIYLGAYPELVNRSYEEAGLWHASYIETYLNKDVRTLTNIGDIRDFSRFLQLLAAQTAQTLDMSHYARDIGVSVPTIKRWLSVLEASYIIFTVQPYYQNFGKRIVKSPKIYFYDTGLVSFFTGINTFEQYNNGPLAGSLFENYIVSEIYKKELHTVSHANLYFLRTQDQAEVDLIVDRKSSKDFIEIKKSATFRPAMVKTLKRFSDTQTSPILLYQGESYSHDGVEVMPYQDYLMR